MQEFELYIEAKKRISKIVDIMETARKKRRKEVLTKKGKETLKIMKDFLNCNITNLEAIQRKYNIVSKVLEEYYSGKVGNETTSQPEKEEGIS